MDTVTEAETAIALSEAGGFATVHRFLSPDEQAAEVRRASEAGATVGAAIGITDGFLDRAEAVMAAGADALVVDVAHGHLEKCLDATAQVREAFPDAELIAGNVATPSAVHDLADTGVDAVKVGIGAGSHCTTREVAGAGVPQLTAVDDCAAAAEDHDLRVIADGGVRSSGDAVKALMAGADTVMLGRLFAATDEAPGELIERDGDIFKRSRGMATTAANRARSDKTTEGHHVDEGVEGLTEYQGSVAEVVEEFASGIQSGSSYCGGRSIEAARESATFIRTEEGTKRRNSAHGVVLED
jgi:IMP dehydrogenase